MLEIYYKLKKKKKWHKKSSDHTGVYKLFYLLLMAKKICDLWNYITNKQYILSAYVLGICLTWDISDTRSEREISESMSVLNSK